MPLFALLIIGFIIGYLFGSIPFGLLLTQLARTPDIRTIGSGNIGATNVLRTGRKGLAAATLLLDALKGTAGVIVAGFIGGPYAALIAGLGAFHQFGELPFRLGDRNPHRTSLQMFSAILPRWSIEWSISSPQSERRAGRGCLRTG